MSDSEEDQDPFDEFGYDSDKDKEYYPPIDNDSSDNENSFTQRNCRKKAFNFLRIKEGQAETERREETKVGPERLAEVDAIENANVQDQINDKKKEAKKLTPKKQRNPATWQANIRKSKREQGEEYVSARKKVVPAKSIKNLKDCSTCRFKCSTKISEEERADVFKSFYTLNKLAKNTFIVANCEQHEPDRRRNRRFFFTVNERKIQICKKYFLGTLDLSQKTIYNAMNNRTSYSNMPQPIRQGCHIKKKIPTEIKSAVIDHIKSFPRVESHYCRADTKREYLESDLSVVKMYELYIEKMHEKNLPCVKLSQYRYIFCNNFNIYFQKPKKDRCDVCELNKLETAEGKEVNQNEEYLNHIRLKNAARKDRNLDRNDKNKPVLTFDLQNVLTNVLLLVGSIVLCGRRF
ncbi:uncharacterized protein [Onthophagus taurus]|uniref:uncharacterized protein n=1 Tax=Onthophagus taurus TaxID=166361 RepID=UPI0039BEC900